MPRRPSAAHPGADEPTSNGQLGAGDLPSTPMFISRLVTALLAPAGVVAAHALAYSAAHGWEHERQAMLTGHGPLAVLAAVALPLLFVALVVVVVTGPAGARPGVRQQATTHLAVFAAVDYAERVAGVASLASLVHDPAVWIGVAAQVATAMLVLLLVRATDQLVAACSVVSEAPMAWHVGAVWQPSTTVRARPPSFLASSPRRAPPVLPAPAIRS